LRRCVLSGLSSTMKNNRGRDGPLCEGAGAVDLSINAAILFEIKTPGISGLIAY